MRFDDVRVSGLDRAGARPLPGDPSTCEVPVLLSSEPPVGWRTGLREILAGHPSILPETRIDGDRLLLRAPLDRIASAYRELPEILARANRRFRRRHESLLEAQRVLDRTLERLETGEAPARKAPGRSGPAVRRRA